MRLVLQNPRGSRDVFHDVPNPTNPNGDGYEADVWLLMRKALLYLPDLRDGTKFVADQEALDLIDRQKWEKPLTKKDITEVIDLLDKETPESMPGLDEMKSFLSSQTITSGRRTPLLKAGFSEKPMGYMAIPIELV